MKYFDIEQYNKNRGNSIEYIYTDSFGNQIVETSSKKGYGHYVEYKDIPKMTYIYNFYSNAVLKEEGKSFDGFRIGIWNFYNEEGILTKEIDYDKPFEKYPLEKVLEYMKSRNADLSGIYTRIYREVNKNGVPMWYLTWDANQRTKEDCLTMINIEINAKQGEIVKEYHHFFWEYNNPYDKVPTPIVIFDKTAESIEKKQPWF